MGTIIHHTIVVTSFDKNHIEKARRKVKKLIAKLVPDEITTEEQAVGLVSETIQTIANADYSFFIAPDGSKEGWSPSNRMNEVREQFIEYLEKSDIYCDYVEIAFGGDLEEPFIINYNKR